MGKPAKTVAATEPKQPPSEKTELAVAADASSSGALMTAADADLMQEFEGSGMENVTAKDILIPRITILQALSDQLKKKHGSYIEDAEVGDICDVGTNEVMPRPLHFLPVVFNKVWLEWAPRGSQTKLVNIHPTDEILALCKENERRQPTLANGNTIAETVQIYGLNLSAGGRQSFIAFTSTQLRKSKRWMALATNERLRRSNGTEYVPPLFFRSYMLDTVEESNTQGDWSGWTITRDKSLPELYGAKWLPMATSCKAFVDQIIKGAARGDLSNMTDDPSTIVEGDRTDSDTSDAKAM